MEPPEFPPEEELAQDAPDEYVEQEYVEQEPDVYYEPGILTRLRSDYALIALLALAVLVNFALLGFLLVRYDAIPDPLPLHFDASGLPDRIGSKSDILALPSIGLIVFGMNAVLGLLAYRKERAATMLLTAGSVFVQILMWLAALNVAGGL